MEAEDILQSLGGYGRYQFLTYLLLGYIYMRGAWHVFAILFIAHLPEPKAHGHTGQCKRTGGCYNKLVVAFFSTGGGVKGADPGHECTLPNSSIINQSLPSMYTDGGCKVLVEIGGVNESQLCPDGYSYGSMFESTILTQWNLVCDKDYMVDLSTTIYMIGNSLGAVLITPFSDRFGRKWVLLISLWIQGVIGVGLAFVNSYALFVCLRFFIGCLNMAVALITYVMITELFYSKCRTRPSIGASLFWSSGLMLLALFGYLVRDWRHLELIISLPNFLTLPFIWFLPESIPWLVSQKKYKHLKQVVSYAARINQKEIPEIVYHPDENNVTQTVDDSVMQNEREVVDSQEKMVQPTNIEVQKYTALDLFKTSKLRRYTIIMFFLWFINSLGYFGILFSTPTLSGDMFVNFVLSGAVEIPACFICMFALEKVGRRKPLVIFLMICGIMNIATVFIPQTTESGRDLSPLIITFAMIGKFGISGAYSTIYLYSTEIFPTVVRFLRLYQLPLILTALLHVDLINVAYLTACVFIRNQALGLSSFFENIGGIAAPFIVYGAKNLKQMPLVLFGVLTLIGAILCIALPETHNKPLPDTKEDVENKKKVVMKQEPDLPGAREDVFIHS